MWLVLDCVCVSLAIWCYFVWYLVLFCCYLGGMALFGKHFECYLDGMVFVL